MDVHLPDPVELSAGVGRLSAALKAHPAEVQTIHEAITRSGFAFQDAGKMSMSSVILYSLEHGFDRLPRRTGSQREGCNRHVEG